MYIYTVKLRDRYIDMITDSSKLAMLTMCSVNQIHTHTQTNTHRVALTVHYLLSILYANFKVYHNAVKSV